MQIKYFANRYRSLKIVKCSYFLSIIHHFLPSLSILHFYILRHHSTVYTFAQWISTYAWGKTWAPQHGCVSVMSPEGSFITKLTSHCSLYIRIYTWVASLGPGSDTIWYHRPCRMAGRRDKTPALAFNLEMGRINLRKQDHNSCNLLSTHKRLNIINYNHYGQRSNAFFSRWIKMSRYNRCNSTADALHCWCTGVSAT